MQPMHTTQAMQGFKQGTQEVANDNDDDDDADMA